MSREVLIVEDDTDIARLIQLQLTDIDCTSKIIGDGESALQHLQKNHHYCLLILDVMLPGCDGLHICREVRNGNRMIPILMLTAKTGELDRVLGLELGADDYLTKPFSFMELVARVKALLRRSAYSSPEPTVPTKETLRFGDLNINLYSRKVTRGGNIIELTAREFDLLAYFTSHPNRVFTRGELLEEVWGYLHSGYEHTVNTHINRLRGKIEKNAQDPQFITTVWGVGYQFNHVEVSPS
ncbi:MAG: response regulator transcription factor [Pseudomonadota bacterium]